VPHACPEQSRRACSEAVEGVSPLLRDVGRLWQGGDSRPLVRSTPKHFPHLSTISTLSSVTNNLYRENSQSQIGSMRKGFAVSSSTGERNSASSLRTGGTPSGTSQIKSFVRNILPATPVFPRSYLDELISPAHNSNEGNILAARYEKNSITDIPVRPKSRRSLLAPAAEQKRAVGAAEAE
jgi:hypothetical protein